MPFIKSVLKEELKNPYFRELYELDEQKLAIVKPINTPTT